MLAVLAPPASASGLEKLLMPGRVIESHAEFESDCKSCHDPSSDRASAALCVSCHEEIGTDRKNGNGFHGRFGAARKNECTTCHTDHEGRDADIVNLQSGVFDHRWADFALAGSHLRLQCVQCHTAGIAFRDAPSACSDCHVSDDVHDGALGRSCESCHSASRWADVRFDHEGVGFELTGQHGVTACGDCHRSKPYSSTSRKCAVCHAVDDVHSGAKGDACGDCHSTSAWRGIQFDHAQTGFALIDAHAGLACGDCHRRQDFKDNFHSGCVACHSNDDDHQGRNGAECDQCHRPTRWNDAKFSHADTGFPLVGSHAELACTRCHKDDAMEKVAGSCGDCHAVDDTHAGQLGLACETCHSEQSWLHNIAFDHDLGNYPLLGMHATVACGACHESNRFHDANTDCASCHRDDDPHAGSLGANCGTCHLPNDWAVSTFDHNRHTTFALDGAHESLTCSDCHGQATGDIKQVPASCGGCHAADDVHVGEFGSSCDQCHSTASFSDVRSLSERRR